MTAEPVVLRGYQERVVAETIAALAKHARVVVACPTGAGKTVIALHGILPRLPGRTAWVTHRRELARQATEYGLPIDVFMAQGTMSGAYATVIIDEGHHVCAAQYRAIIAQYPTARVIALTATPYRLDGVGLGSCGFSHIVHGPDTYDLTEAGALCRVRAYVPVSESTTAWTDKAVADKIAASVFTKGIVFCRSVKAAEALARRLRHLGISSASVDGTTSAGPRARLFSGFENGDLRVLCNHTVFTEGVDVPAVDLVVLNRFTLSRCLWKQMVGRGTRNAPGKTECTVLDLAGNGVTHGSIYDRELYDLNGKVESTEARVLTKSPAEAPAAYAYSGGEELKEWKPRPNPTRLIASLHRLRSASPLHRFRTA